MSKKISYTVIDETTIQLKEGAKANDIIDLKDSINIDTKYLNQAIVNHFKKQADSLIIQTKADLTTQFDREKKNEIELAVNKYKNLIDQQNNEKITELKLSIEKKQNQLNLLEQQFNLFKQQTNDQLKLAIEQNTVSLNKKHFDEITQLQNEINKLKRNEAIKQVQHIGAELENWCLNQYQNYANCGAFVNTTFLRDNEVVDRTKADFIFKVYGDKIEEEQLLTSICLEMKTEHIDSKVRQKNSDFYTKLDKDRKNKKCEYAILVTELENERDFIWYQINEYEKMYVVRPQYLFHMLSLIYNISHKYKNIRDDLLKKRVELNENQDLKEIYERLDQLKEYLLNKVSTKVINGVNKLFEQLRLISKHSDTAKRICESEIQNTINKMCHEIDNFKLENNNFVFNETLDDIPTIVCKKNNT